MSGKRPLLPVLAAVGHRGFAAGTNLVLTIAAGRALPAMDFAQLALMMATVALLLIPHASFFSEPMLVYGPSNYRASLRRYVLSLSVVQLGFGILCSMGAIVWAFATGNMQSFGLLALVLPLAFCVDFQERSFFMQMRPVVPLASAGVQMLTLVALLFWWTPANGATVPYFLAIYVAALVAANLVLLAAHFVHFPDFGRDAIDLRTMARRHTAFAIWSMTSHLMLFLLTGFYMFILPVLQDLATTANFRAQSAVTGPGAQAFSALGMVAVPMLRVSQTQVEFLGKLWQFVVIITVSGGLFALVAGLFGESAIDFIYADKYGMSPVGYWLAGAYPLAVGYAFLAGSSLRAVDEAGLLARSAIIAVVPCLPIGLFLTWQYGVEGVILAQIIGSLTMAGLCTRALFGYFKKSLLQGIKP